MKDLRSRTISIVLAYGFFLAAYFCAPNIYLALLGGVMFWVLAIEWPTVLGMRLVNPGFWIISLMYPISSFVTLMYLTSRFAVTWPIIPLYPFIAASVVDMAGYFVGNLIGRHRCAPRISPNKTWEGLIGGVVALYAANFFLLWIHGRSCNVPLMWVSTPILAASAIFGDLLISWLKRRQGLKDTGSILPGHGGLLDRLDSVLFIATVMGVYIGGRILLGY